MRKFLYLFVAALVSLAFTACNSCTSNNDLKPGFVYSLDANGDAAGHFDVAFAQGAFDINGDADFVFKFSNDTTAVLLQKANDAVPLDAILLSKSIDNATQYDAALRTDAWLNEQLQITEYSGTYLLHIEGYVKETLTGIKFEVDRTFTNREAPGDNSELAK